MQRLALTALFTLWSFAGYPQGVSVQQYGNVTPGHAVAWYGNGIVGDAGTAQFNFISSFGTTGGPLCASSGTPTTSGGYNQICLTATQSGGGSISLNNFGGGTGGFSFTYNGSPISSTLTGSGTAGDIAAWIGTNQLGNATATQMSNAIGTLGGTLVGTLPNPTFVGQSSATANQIPVYPGSNGALVPTTVGGTSGLFDAICSSTIGQAWVRLTSGWGCKSLGYANPVWWGADPTGSSDSTSALNSALAANSYVIFPPGKFKFASGISYTIASGINAVTIVGSGQDNTILEWSTSSCGITVNYSSISNSAHFRDLTMTTATTDCGNAITLSYTTSDANPANTAISDIYRVTMRGDDGYAVTDYWAQGIGITNVSNVQIDNLTIVGSGTFQGTGINIAGDTSAGTYAVVLNVAKSVINYLATGIFYGSYVQGVTVDQTNFTNTTNAIITGASESGALVQLSVTNSQFAPNSTATNGNGVVAQTAIGSVMFANNFCDLGGTNQTCINLERAAHFTIIGNEIQGIGSTTSNGIAIGTTVSSAPGAIIGNDIFGFSGNAILLEAASVSVNVIGNVFVSDTTTISNSGTGNVIAYNLGYNPVGSSAVAVGASPWTYTAGSSPETEYIRTAGTISSITVGGNQIVAAAAGGTATTTVDLAPNQSMVVTYSSTTPVVVKDVH